MRIVLLQDLLRALEKEQHSMRERLDKHYATNVCFVPLAFSTISLYTRLATRALDA